jgi:hypothetical protein
LLFMYRCRFSGPQAKAIVKPFDMRCPSTGPWFASFLIRCAAYKPCPASKLYDFVTRVD